MLKGEEDEWGKGSEREGKGGREEESTMENAFGIAIQTECKIVLSKGF